MQKPFSAHRLLTLAALLAALPAAAAPGVTDLGTLENDNSGFSNANAISSDGSTVVGQSDKDNGKQRVAVWSGSNWSTKTGLGTLRTDNSGMSRAYAVSHDGSVVAGEADNDNDGYLHATVWSGSNWSTKTDLGTLKADNSGISHASGLSHDGSVVVGFSEWDSRAFTSSHATVWSGSGWATKTDLGTLKTDNSGYSRAFATIGDGSMVFGMAENDNGDIHATVWSGSGWTTKTDLGTLKADNTGGSNANAVSSDGSVVAGYAQNDNGDQRAIVWSGSGWSTKTDLGTLKTDNSGWSSVSGISADGKFAVGYVQNDNGDTRAAV